MFDCAAPSDIAGTNLRGSVRFRRALILFTVERLFLGLLLVLGVRDLLYISCSTVLFVFSWRMY